MVPWISTVSIDWLFRGTTLPRMACTSANLFLLPVMKWSSVIAIFHPCEKGGFGKILPGLWNGARLLMEVWESYTLYC